MSEKIVNGGEDFKRLLWFLIGGSRGGENRAKILNAIRSRPRNVNQLAKTIGVDYRSVQHHMSILQKNNLVQSSGQRYGVVYSIHPWLEHHFGTLEQICLQMGYSLHEPIICTAELPVNDGIMSKVMPRIGLAGDGLHQ